jgi:hypothetical protein
MPGAIEMMGRTWAWERVVDDLVLGEIEASRSLGVEVKTRTIIVGTGRGMVGTGCGMVGTWKGSVTLPLPFPPGVNGLEVCVLEPISWSRSSIEILIIEHALCSHQPPQLVEVIVRVRNYVVLGETTNVQVVEAAGGLVARVTVEWVPSSRRVSKVVMIMAVIIFFHMPITQCNYIAKGIYVVRLCWLPE